MQLPAKNDVPPEVWFAAAIFESVYMCTTSRETAAAATAAAAATGSVRVEESLPLRDWRLLRCG